MPHRTREEILDEIERTRANKALNSAHPAVVGRCNQRLRELQDELRSVPGSGPWENEDTPVVPYRAPSSPPTAPRGRPRRAG